MTRSPAPQAPVTVRVFIQRFSATPRGARLARHLALNQLHGWGIPHGSHASDAAAVVVAELAANAVTHGRVPGRDFELRLVLGTGRLRVEVSDTRAEVQPPPPGHIPTPSPLDSGGRGLLLVEAVAESWEVVDRDPPPGKTVRAELSLLREPLTRNTFDSTVPSDGTTDVRNHERRAAPTEGASP